MINKIVGTVCSANHLAYAKTMAKSFQQFNPDYSIEVQFADGDYHYTKISDSVFVVNSYFETKAEDNRKLKTYFT